jgi:hypothetical protein
MEGLDLTVGLLLQSKDVFFSFALPLGLPPSFPFSLEERAFASVLAFPPFSPPWRPQDWKSALDSVFIV